MNPSVCPNCKYAANSESMWPCRCCLRINQIGDYYEPAGEEAEDSQTGNKSLGKERDA